MFFQVIWIIAALAAINVGLSIIIILKFRKQEQFQTNEAHTNLELINQSLNRLSEIAEKLESREEPVQQVSRVILEEPESDSNQSKEQRAVSMIRRGENSRSISKSLGLSRSEIDLLIASEKLGNGRQPDGVQAYR